MPSVLSYEISIDKPFSQQHIYEIDICIHMVHLNVCVIKCKISNNFLTNDIINDCTPDSKDQESLQLSITSDKEHHMGK